jgi:hypothetical protein
MSEAKPFSVHFAGVPTAPDVEKLEARFKIPEEGEVIPWKEIENVIGLGKGTSRFGTVVDAWRKRMFAKHNVVIGAERGKGLVRLTHDGRMDHCASKTKGMARTLTRVVRVASSTDKSRLSPENRKVADHFDKLGANMRLAYAASSRGVVLPAFD